MARGMKLPDPSRNGNSGDARLEGVLRKVVGELRKDVLKEVRLVSEGLSFVRSRVLRMEPLVQRMAVDVDILKVASKRQANEIAGLKKDVETIKKDVGQLKKDVSQLKKDMGGVRAVLNNHETRLTDVETTRNP